jgi:hypothetical protein
LVQNTRGGAATVAPLRRDTAWAMSEENVALIRAAWEPLTGANLAGIDWSADFLRDILGRTYSPDVELTTLASGVGTGINPALLGRGRRGQLPARVVGAV